MSKEPVAAAPGAEDLRPQDFVYCGKRKVNGGGVGIAIRILSDGKLGESSIYAKLKTKNLQIIGGIYTGAEFSDAKARGLGTARYKGRWDVPDDLIDWRSRDEQVETESRSAKVEADAKKIHEIEDILLPLRRQYERYRFQRDHAGMDALEQAVMRALRARIRADEEKA